MAPRRLILMGLRGSGKSTLAHLVAQQVGTKCVDLDDISPGEAGFASVAEAWSRVGEGGFREAERRALEKVLGSDARVIALGGGTPMAPGASDILRRCVEDSGARLVYLHATPGELRARLAGSSNAHRPALTSSGDVLAEIELVYSVRDPVYRSLASVTLETGGRSLAELVAAAAELIAV